MASPERSEAEAYDVVLTSNYSPWSAYSGGGQKSTHMVASALSRMGLKVAVVFSKTPWEKVAVPADLAYAVHWAPFIALKPGISSPLRFLNGLGYYAVLRRLVGPQTAVHGQGDEASLLAFLPRRGAFHYTNRYPNLPVFLHGRDWSRFSTWVRIFFREPRFVAQALAMRHANQVSATSADSRRELIQAFGLDPQRVHVVYNGIDPIFFTASAPDPAARGILYYGRLTLAKGADLVLAAYARLPEATRREHPLHILGRGPLEPQLKQEAQTLGVGDVVFKGWCTGDQIVAAMQNSRVVFLPSREESFGNTVAESLALGHSVVSTRAGSIPEVAGPHGRLVAEAPTEAWAQALAQALSEALAETRTPAEVEAQRVAMREKFSWEAAARRFAGFYRPV